LDEKADSSDEQALFVRVCSSTLHEEIALVDDPRRTGMKNETKLETTLVVGGTGKTGRRVAERLQGLGIAYRLGSRSAQPAFDWENEEGWRAVLRGVSQAYVTYYPDICVPGAVERLRSFFKLAEDAGLKKVVFLSGRGEAEAEQAEQTLQATNLDWTILRCSFFSQNFSENFFLDAIRAGEVALPITDVGEPFVDAEDIADAAVAALTRPGHSRRIYELTGPRALSFAEAIREIGIAAGRGIRYQSISPEEYRSALLAAQVPTEVVELILYLFGTVLDGRNSRPADGVQQALGRPARDFSDYAKKTAATGVWGSVPVSLGRN
jgi:uncharacterized protein YbjT (DUF2867 family)